MTVQIFNSTEQITVAQQSTLFLRAAAECFARLSRGLGVHPFFVRLCVCHTLQSYQNGSSNKIFTVGCHKDSSFL